MYIIQILGKLFEIKFSDAKRKQETISTTKNKDKHKFTDPYSFFNQRSRNDSQNPYDSVHQGATAHQLLLHCINTAL